MERSLAYVRFVLCRPRNPQNLGAAARAPRCPGIARWATVDPPTHDFEAARRVAAHAEELLAKPGPCREFWQGPPGHALPRRTTARPPPAPPADATPGEHGAAAAQPATSAAASSVAGHAAMATPQGAKTPHPSQPGQRPEP